MIQPHSNYWGNGYSAISTTSPGGFNSVLSKFLIDVDDKICQENRNGAVQQCIKHEVFLYLNGHGTNGRFCYYPINGSGLYRKASYDNIIGEFQRFQNNITIYIFVDSCKSGSLITSGNPILLTNQGKFAVYLITSADAVSPSAVGQTPLRDSGTEDFIQGLQTDGDNDLQKPDDIGDGFVKMVNDAFFANPQRWRRPDFNDKWYYSLELFEPEQVERVLPVP